MADQARRPTFDLKADLLEHPRRYSYVQAIRLLRLILLGSPSDTSGRLFLEFLRIRPMLSLSFPGTDVYDIEERKEEDRVKYLITATFLGLYGASSPLPTHYTEDLLDEASDDKTITRDFLDIFNQPFYHLYFQGWTKYRWPIKLIEEEADDYFERLYCLLGFGDKEFRQSIPNPRRLLRYIGLFSQFPRSAMGLKALLADATDIPGVNVMPNVLRKVQIPEDQRCLLGIQGNTLGEDAYLGEEIDDRMGKIRIQAFDLTGEQFHRLLPNSPSHQEAVVLTGAYLDQPLERELELSVRPEEVRNTALGQSQWSFLGYDTWLFSGPIVSGETQVVFQLDH